MALEKEISWKGITVPNAYSRIVNIGINVLDRYNPQIQIVLHTYASVEERNLELANKEEPSKRAIDTGVLITLTGANAEGWIAQFAPSVYTTLKQLPMFSGAVDAQDNSTPPPVTPPSDPPADPPLNPPSDPPQ